MRTTTEENRKRCRGFWATDTQYQRLTAAATAANMTTGDYIQRLLDLEGAKNAE